MTATRGRDRLLERAVQNFQDQVYAPLELLVAHDADDVKTPGKLAAFGDPRIRVLRAEPGMKLGAIRNLLVDAAQGEFVAQWDDDDWSAPDRLLEQMRVIETSGKDACLLNQVTVVDSTTNRVYVSTRRAWEGNILVRKSALPRYDASLPMREDTIVVQALLERKAIAFLSRPELYVYVYHGSNTWDRAHWERNILGYSKELPPALAAQVLDKLNGRA